MVCYTIENSNVLYNENYWMTTSKHDDGVNPK